MARLNALLITLFAVTSLVGGCARTGEPAHKPEAAPSAPPVVKVAKPERKTLRRILEQPGEIEAFEQTPVFAKISGYVQNIRFDIGDPVKKGAVLAELWAPELDAERKQKEALVEQAEAELKLATHSVAVAEAENRRSRSQFERLARTGKSVLDKETIDESQYGAEASKARLEMAQSDVAVKKARVGVAQANRDQVDAMLQYTRLKAPYDGVVTRRTVDTGHFVQPASGAKAEPIFIVAQTDPVRIFVDVPESDAVLINKGTPAQVRVDALRNREFKGEVHRSSWGLDPKTRTLRTEIDLKNPDGKLRPRMYATAMITVEHPNVLALPVAAVVSQGDHHFCFRVADGKVQRMPVRIGARDANFVEVLKKQKLGKDGGWEDLTGSEEVIITNPASLSDGQAVAAAVGP
ncbi:MAG: efflux RND transporter periplasmic adaptor subunit [Gemmataceae bacterium]|nr:efflux RND transporter periplasmic adaptor subunit [Gemmataceae bacterium]